MRETLVMALCGEKEVFARWYFGLIFCVLDTGLWAVICMMFFHEGKELAMFGFSPPRHDGDFVVDGKSGKGR